MFLCVSRRSLRQRLFHRRARRDPQRAAEKTFSEKNLRTCQALHKSERCGEGLSRKGAKTQRRKALPRFEKFSLRLRAFA
jgi:hypothetical protein